MCPDCKQTHGHFWWCRTARFNRQTYKIVWANEPTISGHRLKAREYYRGDGERIRPPRSQKHLNPKLLAKHGGKLVKI